MGMLDPRQMSRAGLAAYGALLAGMIAMVGYLVLAPEVQSLPAFLGLRMAIGALVAGVVGPVVIRLSGPY